MICPASLKINWQREWKKFTGKDAIILDDRNKNNWHRYYEMGCCDVFITNYESLKKFFVEDFAGGVTRSIKLKPVASWLMKATDVNQVRHSNQRFVTSYARERNIVSCSLEHLRSMVRVI